MEPARQIEQPALLNSILPLELSRIGFDAEGEALLDDVNLNFSDGESSIVLGPNGAGKTLLLRICHGLLLPSRGTVRWQSESIAQTPTAQAMVFQQPVVLRRNVRQNIEYAIKVCGVESSLQQRRLASALKISGLERLANRSARTLSGGEQQRLALARCWAIQPKVLFLDEPTAHLDPSATQTIETMISSFRESGTKIIMITHDLGQARRLADHVVFMHHGKVLEVGPANQFFNSPTSREARAYLAGELLW